MSSTFTWIFPRYKLASKTGEEFISPPFVLNNLEWRIKVYPNGRNEESAGYVSIYLIFNTDTTDSKFEYLCTYKLSILNHLDPKKSVTSTTQDVFDKKGLGTGYAKFMKADAIRETGSGFVKDSNFYIQAEVPQVDIQYKALAE